MDIEQILNSWYNDGMATWSYCGADDGIDGIFGGSFHYMGMVKKFGDNLRVCIDFGSADAKKAMINLNERLSKINCKAEIDGDSIIILNTITKLDKLKEWCKKTNTRFSAIEFLLEYYKRSLGWTEEKAIEYTIGLFKNGTVEQIKIIGKDGEEL